MKQQTRFFAILMAILMILSVTPITSLANTTNTETYGGTFGVDGDNLSWKIENNTLTISGYGRMTEGYGFDRAPWYNYRNLFNKIIIEEGILNIGTYSFYDCDLIEEISFPNTVTTIYDKAIANCEKLKYIYIPESVSNIESPLFHACNTVERINVDEDNQHLSTDERGVLFNKDKTVLYHYPPNNTATHYDIPETVTRIGYNAFYNSIHLKSVQMSDNVSIIDNWAFMFCESLETINLPKSLTKISGQCFDCCFSLTDVEIPENVTTIDYYAFSDCESFKTISIHKNVTSIATNAFNSCNGVETITVAPDNPIYHCENNCIIETATKTLVRGCKNSIIPTDGSVERIGANAFYGTSSLTTIKIPDTVTKIGIYAFGGCDDLLAIEIPDTVTNIGYGLFDSCSRLKNVVLGKGITEIPELMFYRCYALSNIEITNEVKLIDRYAFYRCYSLANIKISNPECEIYASPDTIDSATTIYGYCDSTAQEYAEKYNRKFVAEHHYSSEETTPATHLTEGLMTYTCACGDTYTETIEKTEHSYNAVITPPTCIEQGYTTYTCACNDTYVADYVDATGHSHTATITTPATHLTEGVMTYTCACGDTYTEAIAKTTEHTFTEETIASPTCTAKGEKLFSCECGYAYTEEIAKTSHINADGNYSCDICGNNICSHMCHQSGFMGFIWKLINFFSKLFGTNPVCECGAAHY